MKYDIIIGLDTGKNTGFAVWNTNDKILETVETLLIHEAMERINDLNPDFKVKIRFEDARQRKWFGKAGREQLQGAGSIKRDAAIWEDFLKDKGIDFEPVAPKNNKTKLDAKTFKKITGYPLQTNVHERDAAMLVFGL